MKYDEEKLKELSSLVYKDLAYVTPESDVWVEYPHKAIKIDESCDLREVDFPCDMATRYYEDKQYARVYALSPYENGVTIFVDKVNNAFTIFILGEDDGCWFISTSSYLNWIQGKPSFMALVSECLSILNANYKYE